MRVRWLWALLLLGATCGHAPPQGARAARGSVRHVILVSIDGLMPWVYVAPGDLQVPTLREMVRAGAHSPGMRSVFPTVTYPAHTSLATGAEPAKHGVTSNRPVDGLEQNQEGWYWYTEDIRVGTLWDAASEAGLKVGLVNWPVTVGARADALVPEYWRAGTTDDQKLLRAISTPGLLDAVAARFPDLWERLTPPNVKDDASTDIAVHLIETERPALLLLHIWQTDDAQHNQGPASAEARASFEHADAQLARLVAAAKKAGIWERTVLVVVSDHGFTSATKTLKPGALLREAGLVTLGDDGRPTAWKAATLANGGQCYLYLADPADEATRAALLALFTPLAGAAGSGVRRVYQPDEIRAMGGDPGAALALDAADGFTFMSGYAGDAIGTPKVPGHHGFDPGRDDMRSSFVAWGPPLAPGTVVEGARLIDVAPTIAFWLGLSLPDADGRPLAIPLR